MHDRGEQQHRRNRLDAARIGQCIDDQSSVVGRPGSSGGTEEPGDGCRIVERVDDPRGIDAKPPARALGRTVTAAAPERREVTVAQQVGVALFHCCPSRSASRPTTVASALSRRRSALLGRLLSLGQLLDRRFDPVEPVADGGQLVARGAVLVFGAQLGVAAPQQPAGVALLGDIAARAARRSGCRSSCRRTSPRTRRAPSPGSVASWSFSNFSRSVRVVDEAISIGSGDGAAGRSS